MLRGTKMLTSFSKEIFENLGYYVYRLVDPRNGLTFYVGKGYGNRLFQHVYYKSELEIKEILSRFEEKENLKLEIINEIHAAGLEVIFIVHRHGMDEKTAFEVEGALIDAYGGLANKMNGHYSNDFGITNASEIINLYSKKEFDESEIIKNEKLRFIIIKVRSATIESLFGPIEDRLLEATKGNWRISESKAKKYKYVLCVIDGIVREVYEVEKWNKHPDEFGRYYFSGKVASLEIQKIFKSLKIPSKYRKKGSASPILYYKPL